MSQTPDLIDVKIALLNKPSSQELLSYVRNNLKRFITEGFLKFSFVLVKSSSDRPAEFQNVNEFPAMVTSKGVISGNSSIKEYIETFMSKQKGGKNPSGASSVSSNISDLENYQRSTLLQEDDIDEDPQDSLQERMQRVMQERQNNIDVAPKQMVRSQPERDSKDNFNEIFDAAYNKNAESNGTGEESLMSRFFDNQEETPME